MKNKNVIIYVFTHKDFDKSLIPDNSYVVLKNTDTNNGINIFDKDRAYSEGSQLYYIWKNTKLPEWIGNCQYRKWWDAELPNLKNTDFDIILPEPIIFDGYNNYIQYASVLNINDYRICEMIIQKMFPDYIKDVNKFNSSNIFYPYNMFIMKRDMFRDYCKFVFSILFAYDKIMGFNSSEDVLKYVIEHKENYLERGEMRDDFVSVARTEGHLLERLTNIYILHNCQNIKTIPVKIID